MATLFRPFNSLSCCNSWNPISVFTLVCSLASSKLFSSQLSLLESFFLALLSKGERLQVTVAVVILAEFSLPLSGRPGILRMAVKRFKSFEYSTLLVHGKGWVRLRGVFFCFSIGSFHSNLEAVFCLSFYRITAATDNRFFSCPFSKHMIYWLLSECEDYLNQYNQPYL